MLIARLHGETIPKTIFRLIEIASLTKPVYQIRGELMIMLLHFWFPKLYSKWRKLLRGFSTMLFRGNISISVDLKSVILVILCRLTSHLSRERTNFVRINFLAQIQQSALILRPQKEVSSPQKCPWGETERRQGVTGETHETAF